MKNALAILGLLLAMTMGSCASKVSHESIREKLQSSEVQQSGMPALDEADYEFMVDYLIENLDSAAQIGSYETLQERFPHYAEYSFIVMFANDGGKLPTAASKKFETLRQKTIELNSRRTPLPAPPDSID